MRPSIALVAIGFMITGSGPASEIKQGETEMEMKSLTPILYVEEIEPALGFWKGLGFEVTAEVPEGDRLGFVILRSGSVEIMYQTRASVENDAPSLVGIPMGGGLLFIQVGGLDDVIAALGDAEVVLPRRQTFYGADEIGVREPGGNLVTFAYFADREEG